MVSHRWDRRPAADQHRRRDQVLAGWLPEATSYAPYWASVSMATGIVPGTASTTGALARFTPSIQGDIARRGGNGLVQRPTEAQLGDAVQEPWHRRLSSRRRADLSGQTREQRLEEFKPIHVTRAGVDEDLVVSSSKSDLVRSLRSGARAASVLGLTDHDQLVSAVPAGPTADYWRVQAVALGAQLLAFHPRGHGDDLDRCGAAFSLVPVTAVACRPDEAVAWAAALAATDADVSRVVFVLLFGPPGDDEQRGAVEDAWRAAGAQEHELVVRYVWSPDVHRTVWTECAAGTDGLHTQPDLEIVELLDPTTGHVVAEDGDLTITTLAWRGTTLLRHRTGSRVARVETRPCPSCRRTVPRAVGAVVEAAWHLRLERASGVVWMDTRAIDRAVDGLAGIDDWRVVVDDRGDGDGYRVEVAGIDGVARRLAERIESLTGIAASRSTRVEDRTALTTAISAQGHVVDER